MTARADVCKAAVYPEAQYLPNTGVTRTAREETLESTAKTERLPTRRGFSHRARWVMSVAFVRGSPILRKRGAKARLDARMPERWESTDP
jgi:hypothetical protein